MKEVYLKHILKLEQREAGWVYVDKKEGREYPVSEEQKEHMMRYFVRAELVLLLVAAIGGTVWMYYKYLPWYISATTVIAGFGILKVYMVQAEKIINNLKGENHD